MAFDVCQTVACSDREGENKKKERDEGEMRSKTQKILLGVICMLISPAEPFQLGWTHRYKKRGGGVSKTLGGC